MLLDDEWSRSNRVYYEYSHRVAKTNKKYEDMDTLENERWKDREQDPRITGF